MEDVFHKSHSPAPSATSLINIKSGPGHKSLHGNEVKIRTSEDTIFGLKPDRYAAEECLSADPTGKRRWTTFPPCRFSAEFWDVNALQEKTRLHSQTIWYAGNLYNVYVQIAPKKAGGPVQLGIYLHRQSSIEPIPQPSSPYPPIARSTSADEQPLTRVRSTFNPGPLTRPSPFSGSPTSAGPLRSLHASRSLSMMNEHHRVLSHSSSFSPLPSMSSSPNRESHIPAGAGSGPLSPAAAPYTTTAPAPSQPYRDPRSCVPAYFSVSCANSTGTSQMRFTSAPDAFTVGQSWGWKASTLRTEEYMELKAEADADVHQASERDALKSLRVTVTLGLI